MSFKLYEFRVEYGTLNIILLTMLVSLATFPIWVCQSQRIMQKHYAEYVKKSNAELEAQKKREELGKWK